MLGANSMHTTDTLVKKMDQASSSDNFCHSCSACGKDAQLRCQACHPIEIITDCRHEATWYCSKECQKNAWSSHKSYCREVMRVNQLYRAAHFCQEVFYHYRERAFDFPVQRITTKGSRIDVYESDPKGKTLFPFPEKLVKTREDKEALLSYRACESALGRMNHMFALAFEGLYKNTTEVCFDAKNPKREMYRPQASTTYYLPDGSSIDLGKPIMSHLILRVSLKGGKDYAVDLSGAQFGFHEPILPWTEYETQRIQKIQVVQPPGKQKSVIDNWRGFDDAGTMAALRNGKAIGDEMDEILDGWLRSEDAKLSAIMTLVTQAYETKSSQILQALEDGMAKFVGAGASNKDLIVATEDTGYGMIYLVKGNGSKERIDMLL